MGAVLRSPALIYGVNINYVRVSKLLNTSPANTMSCWFLNPRCPGFFVCLFVVVFFVWCLYVSLSEELGGNAGLVNGMG